MFFRIPPFARVLRVPAALLLLIMALPGQALTFCVGNALELANALNSAAASPDTSIYINILKGTYTGNFSLSVNHPGQVYLSGGWSSLPNSPCNLQSFGADGTTLIGMANSTALTTQFTVSSSAAYVSDLTISNPNNGRCVDANNTGGG